MPDVLSSDLVTAFVIAGIWASGALAVAHIMRLKVHMDLLAHLPKGPPQ